MLFCIQIMDFQSETWTDEVSRYKKSILPTLWRKCFDVDNDDDRSFSTRGL